MDKAYALLAHFNSVYILDNKSTSLFSSVTSSSLNYINNTPVAVCSEKSLKIP